MSWMHFKWITNEYSKLKDVVQEDDQQLKQVKVNEEDGKVFGKEEEGGRDET